MRLDDAPVYAGAPAEVVSVDEQVPLVAGSWKSNRAEGSSPGSGKTGPRLFVLAARQTTGEDVTSADSRSALMERIQQKPLSTLADTRIRTSWVGLDGLQYTGFSVEPPPVFNCLISSCTLLRKTEPTSGLEPLT